MTLYIVYYQGDEITACFMATERSKAEEEMKKYYENKKRYKTYGEWFIEKIKFNGSYEFML